MKFLSKLLSKLIITLLIFLFVVAISAHTDSVAPAYAASLPSTLNFDPIVSGLTQPVFLTHAGDHSNRLFILQQTGQIRILKNGSLLLTPFINLSGQVPNFTDANSEQGLLGLAFDPSYPSNGYFYITYTTNNNDPTFHYTTTLARYHISSGNPDIADISSGTVLLSIPKKYTNHNGGMIAFGPDGYLYMSMGDGGSGGDPDNNAQNLHTLLGKLLRLDVHTSPPAGQKYVIPSTNPFYNDIESNIKKEIWAYGLRNPWRFSFDLQTGDLYIGDVGQNIEEEVDFQDNSSMGGQNYGWRILEGNLCYNPSSNCVTPAGYAPPVAVYDHGNNDSFGCAVTGGYVYRGTQYPSLQGVYLYGDYCSGKVLGLIKTSNNTWTSNLIVPTNYSLSSFGEDEQGEIYLADYGSGVIYHISAKIYTISGTTGVSGTTLSYTNGLPKTIQSDASGNYAISVPAAWSGTVTPSRPCYTFSPANRTYNNLNNNSPVQDYVPSLNLETVCIASIVRADPNPTSANTVQYTVTFTKPVTGVDTGDFALITAGVSGAGITTVSGSGALYTVTVSTGNKDGTLRLDIVSDATIADASMNFLSNLPFAGEVYGVVKTTVGFASADFNGNGRTDVAIFRPSNSPWYIQGVGATLYGQPGDIPVPADYDGDGKADIAVFRPSESTWYIRGQGSFVYGTTGDIPVPDDYDGDGKADIAVFRPANSTWYILGVGPRVYGTVGDIPVVADYNGDGKADIAVFRPGNNTWYIYGVGRKVYGTAGDIPAVADYDGDKKADIAVFRPTNSTWYLYGVGPKVYGKVGDVPVIGDYNGGHKADIAVFRPSSSTWYIYGIGPSVYGTVGDMPV